MAKYRDSWYTAVFSILNVVWRPHLLAILVFEVSFCLSDVGLRCSPKIKRV